LHKLFGLPDLKFEAQSSYERVVELPTNGSVGPVHTSIAHVFDHRPDAVLYVGEFGLGTPASATLTATTGTLLAGLGMVGTVAKAILAVTDSLPFAPTAIGFYTGTLAHSLRPSPHEAREDLFAPFIREAVSVVLGDGAAVNPEDRG
jgi:hypothetical protein